MLRNVSRPRFREQDSSRSRNPCATSWSAERGVMRIAGILLAVSQLLQSHFARSEEAPAPLITLSRECPPSFELVDGHSCRFRSLYDQYSSSPGSGGLRVRLPALRDGFSPEEIDLGRYLFYDPLLSRDHGLSCSQCHRPGTGFADGLPRSEVRRKAGGAAGSAEALTLRRGAPSLWNVGFLKNLFWDGRAHSLEQQVLGPLFSPIEMDNTKQGLESDLNRQRAYRTLFADAFSLKGSQRITTAMIIRALAAFESSLVSVNSAYDRYAHGDDQALTERQKHGYALFRGVALGCSECHTPPLFTNDEIEVTGVPNAAALPFDAGAGEVTKQAALRGGFKTPTLRNVSLTAPYMHAGQFGTLRDVVRFYDDRPGHAAPTNEKLTIDWRIALRRPVLSEDDISDLVAFLHSLTDESLLPPVPEHVPSGLPVSMNSLSRVAVAGPIYRRVP